MNIDIIKEKLNILTLASSVTSLQKSGRSYKGLCPFHSEKTPSFYVWPSTNTFKCFGCGKSGSSLDMYMHIHGMSFSEAVSFWERELGLISNDSPKPKRYCPLKSQDFQNLSLHPKSMRALYEEDREGYYFVLGNKIREKWLIWTNMLSTIPNGPKEMKEVIQTWKDYYWNLWFEAVVKDKEKWRTSHAS
ncbi:hypothetical protein JK635_08000 [Neobacillus sp. YIM B02564]|uniref:Zinc finger CHC2-type domain-containing protein n=1 Tax=Neobacillus paridis TaxID=2803862 RepID=A0ABS1TNK6_9BACI|nr:CHC2 zinc finger domain-containing protein [Neobacillus paridis]MBL4952153.1 hypothetical protein [Neobacillus paridis]